MQINYLNDREYLDSQLNEIAERTVFTFSLAHIQFCKNRPTNIQKWKENIIIDINVSTSLGFYGIAPRWQRKIMKRIKNENI